MNNAQRDEILTDIHTSVNVLNSKVDTNTGEIKTLRVKVDEMSGNKWQIKGLYAVWGLAVSAIGWLVVRSK